MNAREGQCQSIASQCNLLFVVNYFQQAASLASFKEVRLFEKVKSHLGTWMLDLVQLSLALLRIVFNAYFIFLRCTAEAKCSPINPCLNGGRCQEMPSTYICICKNGFAGRNCDGIYVFALYSYSVNTLSHKFCNPSHSSRL